MTESQTTRKPANDDPFLASLPTIESLVRSTVALDGAGDRDARRGGDWGPAAEARLAEQREAEWAATQAAQAALTSTLAISQAAGQAGSAATGVSSREVHREGGREGGREAEGARETSKSSAASASASSNNTASANASEETRDERTHQAPPRKVVTPILLFIATCLSTFWVGVTHWQPVLTLPRMFNASGMDLMLGRQLILSYWQEGLIYMAAVMGILLVHELGHFFATLIYKVRASLPVFLPFPFNPIGTFGAVIGMHGGQADRKQIFDIGIAGPLAGLVIAIPVMIVGVMTIDVTGAPRGDLQMHCPWGVALMIQWLRPDIDLHDGYLWLSHVNSWFVAGWVGFLVTGLNMMPISQLDGGHVSYTLMGRKAHLLARTVVVVAIAFMVYYWAPTMVLMTILLLVVGTDHPPTRDDSVKLGAFRTALGWVSLSIPVLCFPLFIFRVV